ncbi:MAG: ribonuclease P protein component [Saprospirales bacterium]|nr:ribonuclease P protein component [Saprospirales bacterium]
MITEQGSHIRFTFSSNERLKSKKLIDELFSYKTFVQNSTVRIYYKSIELNCAFPAQFAFAVSKKIFPLAKDRNSIKRLMRESVRLQKPAFYQILQEKNKQLILLLSYHSKKISTLKEIDESITKLLNKVLNEL